MSYSLSFALDLGTSGLTLKAALVAANTIHATFRDVTTTFYADGQGGYEFLTAAIPDGYRGIIVFYTGTLAAASDFSGVVIQSRGSVNPEEAENLKGGAVALAATALSNVLWTSAVVSDIGQGAGSAVRLEALLTPTRAGYLDNLSDGPVAQASSALSNVTWTDSFQTTLDNGMTNVSSIATRTSAIKAKTDNLPASPAAVGSAMTLTSAYDSAKTATSALGLLDTALSGHTTSGTVGGALSSASASGDPWATIVPAGYATGTAGAALGKLNIVPAGQSAVVIPNPADDVDLCTVYLNAEDIENNLSEGITVTFQLVGGPAHSERMLQVVEVATLVTDDIGHGSVTLQRNDLLTPTTTHYRVNCGQLGLNNRRVVLHTSLFNLMDLVSA